MVKSEWNSIHIIFIFNYILILFYNTVLFDIIY